MYYYIYNKGRQEFTKRVVEYIKNKELKLQEVEVSQLDTLDLQEDDHLLVTGKVEEIKEVIAYAYEHQTSLGIVPLEEQKELIHTFSLPRTFEESIDLALSRCAKKIDLLYCY